MKPEDTHSSLLDEIESYQREDGTVWMSIGVVSKDMIDKVIAKLSRYGRIIDSSEYVPFFDIIFPDIITADNFAREYERNSLKGDFEHVTSVEVPGPYYLCFN